MKFSILFLAILGSTLSASAQSTDTTLLVNGVCDMCKKTIESALDIDGVEEAEWSSETKILTLSYNPASISMEEINRAIVESGYDTEFATATEEAYNALHPCCHYRDPEVQEAH